ncbi:MAG: GNAT family N-acetyltransferase [Nisaea sp.]|uniref:GNAT family N-acetyltransferase n=1 Tax=Nisaea sp. TaxID=2024842 RepID=UPI001B2A0279|nr:GNAT family protein [Nisaea sp.]MBO6559277.1 GNAT family N-acetyltransferase [Nisaea sp.]
MKVEPVTLTGKHVRLEPLSESHIPALQKAAEDPAIWKWTWPGTDPKAVEAYIHLALENQEKGMDCPFATVDVASGEVAGSTRYMTIDTKNKRVEIGSTWINPRFQRTPINTEAKYMMLRHAFETLGCIRVEFKTHHRNEQSQNALKRIGAIYEGTLRQHMIHTDGTLRDSVYFSILDKEWAGVKEMLEAKLAAR